MRVYRGPGGSARRLHQMKTKNITRLTIKPDFVIMGLNTVSGYEPPYQRSYKRRKNINKVST